MPDFVTVASEVRNAYHRIQRYIRRTHLVRDEHQCLWLKCEQDQHTGSFKFRGALSRLSLVPAGQKIVTASTGNHGLGVARAAGIFGLEADIFLPASAAKAKVKKLKQPGVQLHFIHGDSLQAELAAKSYANERGLTWVSPYNDPFIIAGQGTIGLELCEDLSAIDNVYITVGGGGLISGIASFVRSIHPQVNIIGCQPVNSPEMYLSIRAGHVVQAPESKTTLSDGSAGPLEQDSITFPLCQSLINRFVLITEPEIEHAIRYAFFHHGLIIEGAAGVALAAALRDPFRSPVSNSVVVLCGGNIAPDIHRQICYGLK